MNKLLKIKWLLVAGILAIQALAAPGQEVSPDYGNYDSGEEIIVTFSEGPGNPKDWVGLYKQDMVAGEVDSLAWFYVNGTKSSGDGLTEGELTFPDGMTDEGYYEARFFEDDGYTLLGQIDLRRRRCRPNGVKTDKSSYTAGRGDHAGFSLSAPAIRLDWVGLYREDMVPGDPSAVWCGFMSTEPRLVVKELNPEHLHLPMV